MFNRPVSCQDGHSFCHYCTTQWELNHNLCPVDRNVLSGTLVRNLVVEGAIRQSSALPVWCGHFTQWSVRSWWGARYCPTWLLCVTRIVTGSNPTTDTNLTDMSSGSLEVFSSTPAKRARTQPPTPFICPHLWICPRAGLKYKSQDRSQVTVGGACGFAVSSYWAVKDNTWPWRRW